MRACRTSLSGQISQSAATILMVRPANFGFNPQTAASNAFQSPPDGQSAEEIRGRAVQEFEGFVQALQGAGVEVVVHREDFHPERRDAVFPNNWVSFHEDGTVVLYPMASQARRLERSAALIAELSVQYGFSRVVDLSGHEAEGRYLEGTGSVVFDYPHRRAYACRSARTDDGLFFDLCARLGFAPLLFDAVDADGRPIYHTNVMMNIGSGYAVVGLEAVSDPLGRLRLEAALQADGVEVIALSHDQLRAFAGNMLEVEGAGGARRLVMSAAAHRALHPAQLARIRCYAEPLVVEIPTIEQIGGGSARCMMAAVRQA